MSKPLIAQIFGLSSELLPSGGTTGQVLSKTSNSDYAVTWSTPSSGGSSSEPLFLGSPAYNITTNEITNWNTAYGWGSPTSYGFLTSETDPIFTASPSYNITSTEISHWNTVYGYGNWTTQGFLTSESDPIFTASAAYGITSTNITQWNSAYADEHVHNNFGLLQTLITTGPGTNALMDNGTYTAVLTFVGGSNTQIQYNNSGVLSGASTVTFNSTSNTLSTTNLIATSQVQIGNSSTYLNKDVSGNLNFTDAVVGTKTLSQLIGGATNYWNTVTGGINYAGKVGINSPSSLTDTLTVAGTISATNFDSSYFQYNNNNNLLLGPNAGTQDSGSNKLYIANTNISTPLIYGEFNNQLLKFYASTFIGSGYTLNFSNSIVNISNTGSNNLTFQDAIANSGSPVTLVSLINGTYNALKSDFVAYSTVASITSADLSTWNKASILITTGSSTNYLGQDGSYHAVSTGSMTNPMTNVGDIIIGGTSGTPTRLGIGTSTQYLTVVGGSPAWSTFPIIGRTESSGYFNTAIGYASINLSTTGSYNTGIGESTLSNNTTGYINVAIGQSNLTNNTTGSSNLAIGYHSMLSNTTGFNNVGIGQLSLYSNITGNYNIAIGNNAGEYETGSNQFYLNNIEQANLANERTYSLLWGTFSSTAGSIVGQQLTVNGTLNVVGPAINLNGSPISGGSMTWPSGGAGVPYYSGSSTWGTTLTTSGTSGILLETNGNGGSLTGITPQQLSIFAIPEPEGPGNTSLGYLAMNNFVTGGSGTGSFNTAIGQNALMSLTTGSNNTGIGRNTLPYTTTGIQNTALGYLALYSNISGSSNVAIGNQSLYSNSTGNLNVAIGNAAGYFETGTNQFYINNVNQGSQANDRAYSLLWGTFSGTAGSISGQQLTINGNVNIPTGCTYSINGVPITGGGGSLSSGALLMASGSTLIGYTNQTAGAFDTSSTAPTHTNRLNYDGYFYSSWLIATSQINIIIGGNTYTNFVPGIASNGSAIAYLFGTQNNLNTSGDKLASFRNYGIEEAYIDYQGSVVATRYVAGNYTPGGSSSITGNGVLFNNSGNILSYVGSVAKMYLAPNTAGTSGNTVYTFDTGNTMPSGAYLMSVNNNGTQKFSIDYAGNINIPTGSNYQINGTPIAGTTPPSQNQTFSGQFSFTNPYYTSYNAYTVTSNISITASSTKVNGSSCVIVMTSDGTHAPVFTGSGFYVFTGSNTFSLTEPNVIVLTCIGTNIYYNISNVTGPQ